MSKTNISNDELAELIQGADSEFNKLLIKYLSLYEDGEKVYQFASRVLMGEDLVQPDDIEESATDLTVSMLEYLALKKPQIGIYRNWLTVLTGLAINPGAWIFVLLLYQMYEQNHFGLDGWLLLVGLFITCGLIFLSNMALNKGVREIRRNRFFLDHPDFHSKYLTLISRERLHCKVCEECGAGFTVRKAHVKSTICPKCIDDKWK